MRFYSSYWGQTPPKQSIDCIEGMECSPWKFVNRIAWWFTMCVSGRFRWDQAGYPWIATKVAKQYCADVAAAFFIGTSYSGSKFCFVGKRGIYRACVHCLNSCGWYSSSGGSDSHRFMPHSSAAHEKFCQAHRSGMCSASGQMYL